MTIRFLTFQVVSRKWFCVFIRESLLYETLKAAIITPPSMSIQCISEAPATETSKASTYCKKCI